MSDPAPPIPVDDAADPRVEVFTKIKERDRIGREHVFIAEGESVLNVFLGAPLERISILVEASRIPRVAALERRGETPLFAASPSVIDAIAGFHIHRGILAAGRIPQPLGIHDLPAGPLSLPVLVGVSNHDNVGGIYRNAAAFGAAAVAVDSQTADPFYRKSIRVGVGAPLTVPTVRLPSAADALEALRAADIVPYALTPAAGSTISAADLPPRAAFLFGTEGPGLDRSLLEACEPLAIAMAPGFDSLNVATASGIALHAHFLASGRHLRPAEPAEFPDERRSARPS